MGSSILSLHTQHFTIDSIFPHSVIEQVNKGPFQDSSERIERRSWGNWGLNHIPKVIPPPPLLLPPVRSSRFPCCCCCSCSCNSFSFPPPPSSWLVFSFLLFDFPLPPPHSIDPFLLLACLLVGVSIGVLAGGES